MKRSALMSLSFAAVSLGAIATVGLLNNQFATAQTQPSQQEQPQEQPQIQPEIGCNEGDSSTEQTI